MKLLAEIRKELMAGDTSFLSAVAEFYHAFDEDEDEEEEEGDAPETSLDAMSKAELLEECERRGVEFRKSWTKAQLRDALTSRKPARPATVGKRKLSRAARAIVDQLENL